METFQLSGLWVAGVIASDGDALATSHARALAITGLSVTGNQAVAEHLIHRPMS